MSLSIQQLERKLDEMFEMVDALPNNEAKARLAEYLCIRTSGLLEKVVKQLISEFIEGSQQETNKFVSSKIQMVSNLNHPKLRKLLESFSLEWRSAYLESASVQEIASLNSILDLRNSIAHGGSQTTSYGIVKGHYDNVKSVIGRLKVIIRKRGRQDRVRRAA